MPGPQGNPFTSTLPVRVLGVACVFAVVASIAAASWGLYAVAVRRDWLGLGLGLGAVIYALVWGAGIILIDRGLRRLHERFRRHTEAPAL
jgi:hypothetical protein